MISVIFVQTSLWLGKFIFSSNEAVRHDFLWVLAAFLWFCKQEIRHGLLNSPSIEGSLAIILAFCLICYYLMISHQHDPGSPSYQEGKSIEKELPSYPKALRPLIFPCRTSHTRIFPQRHSFSYSYFFVGIPVCCQDPVGSLFPVNPNEIGSNHGRANGAETVVTGFDVDAVDYLNRGDHHQGLNGKLIDFLKAQNEDPKEYYQAYLVTAPRFLGYSFNPASFWYLYNRQEELHAMIVEVNNTFDERRIYFLKNRDIKTTDTNEKTERNHETFAKFKSAWQKDFHVSPFNSRKGSYALSAHDPFFPHLTGKGAINNTITLSSSKGHTKIVARVFSTQECIDPKSLNLWQKTRLIISWWWVGLVTYPRIIREAGKLFFRKKLHVWYRPEVLSKSIGRRETKDEKLLEPFFKSYLRSQVENSSLPSPLTYTSALSTIVNSETYFPTSLPKTPTSSPSSSSPITLKITTPLFYTLFARASNPTDFLSSSLSPHSPHPPQTFHTSHPSLIPALFLPPKDRLPQPPNPFSLIQLLRTTPSPLDHHIQQTFPGPQSRQYRKTILKLLLTDIFLGGFVPLADLFLLASRLTLFYIYASWIRASVLSGSCGPDVGGLKRSGFNEGGMNIFNQGMDMSMTEWVKGFGGLAGTGIHIWWLCGELI